MSLISFTNLLYTGVEAVSCKWLPAWEDPLVLQWQPSVEDIKEVCLKIRHYYNITAAIYGSSIFHGRFLDPWLIIWSKQLWASGFWADNKKT
jgi:hypothetical protein